MRQKEPLRTVSEDERAVLAVAEGASYTAAAPLAGRRSGDAVARLVARFNTEGWMRWSRGTGVGARRSIRVRSASAS